MFGQFGFTANAACNANNQLTQWGTTQMTYDLDGNTLNDGTNAYVWDARNRLVSANSGGAAYAYDPLGRRILKTLLSSSTGFLYDGVNPVQELNGTTPTANLLTGGVDERFQRTDATGTYSYLTDALGSTEALTDSTGAQQATYSYSPYGSMSISGSTTNSYGYTGRESDGLGIDYYRARYYNPAIGRFISEDPMGFRAGPNFYAYAGDNPVTFIDPFGMDRGPGPGCGGGLMAGCNAPSYNPDCAPCLNPGALDPTQPEGHEPNPLVSAVADLLGVGGAVTGNFWLGGVSSGMSVGNNPSVPNLILTAESNLIPLVVEGSDVPIAFAFAAYDGSQFVGNVFQRMVLSGLQQENTPPYDDYGNQANPVLWQETKDFADGYWPQN